MEWKENHMNIHGVAGRGYPPCKKLSTIFQIHRFLQWKKVVYLLFPVLFCSIVSKTKIVRTIRKNRIIQRCRLLLCTQWITPLLDTEDFCFFDINLFSYFCGIRKEIYRLHCNSVIIMLQQFNIDLHEKTSKYDKIGKAV